MGGNKNQTHTNATRNLVTGPLLNRYERPFTVLEVGSSESATCATVVSDYPSSVFVFYGTTERKKAHYLRELSGKENVIWLNKTPSPKDLELFSLSEHVDVLIFNESISHKWKSYLNTCEKLAHTVIFVLSKDHSQGDINAGHNFFSSSEGLLDRIDREDTVSYILESPPNFQICKSTMLHPVRKDRTYLIECDYTKKLFHKVLDSKKRITTDWVQGINLVTFLMFNGNYPTRRNVVKYLPFNQNHKDWMPNNMILKGASISLIDHEEKAAPAKVNHEKCVNLILKSNNKSPEQIRDLFCKIFHVKL